MFVRILLLSASVGGLFSARPAAAEELSGVVGAVLGDKLAIVVTSPFSAMVGDRVNVFVDVPAFGPLRIATATVTHSDGELALAHVEQSLGRLAVKQTVRIDSPQARRRE